jgi:spore germination protein YaaH
MINSIDEKDLENVTGGWQYANGDYENYGNFIIYTIAPGDILKNICQRFGVSEEDVIQWNNIRNPEVLFTGVKLTIKNPVLG